MNAFGGKKTPDIQRYHIFLNVLQFLIVGIVVAEWKKSSQGKVHKKPSIVKQLFIVCITFKTDGAVLQPT